MPGHEYLTTIGILHRDISENNIVLGLRPEHERGYLIDFDMAILQNAEQPTQRVPATLDDPFLGCGPQKSFTPYQSDNNKPMKALRTVSTLLTSCHC
jgi:serine/threonine protein kinase